MKGKLLGRKMRKGVSDLIVILTLVAIAIPVALAVQGWLSSQASKVSSFSTVPNFDSVVLSKSSNGSTQVYVIKLRNLGDYSYDLESLNSYAIIESGKYINATNISRVAFNKVTLEPGDSIIISVTFETTDKIKNIVLELLNKNTNKVELIEVNVA